jgi:hypothetical protein
MEFRFDVYGRLTLIVRRSQERWEVFSLGADGKRGAEDLVIPSHIPVEALESYLEEIFHEWATPERPEVRRL